MVDESYFDDLDRSLLKASSWMADIFSNTYGALAYRLVAPLEPNKFDNAASKANEIGIRLLIIAGSILSLWFAGTFLAITAVVLFLGSKLFRAVGFAMQKDGFTHMRGSAPEKFLENGQASVMTWNLRGGLHYEHGVIHWSSRIDAIVKSIKKEDPDVIVLQEIYDTALVEELVEKLGDQYAHFFTHLGQNTWGNTSGCMVITKCVVDEYTHTDFDDNGWRVNRGFETIEIKAHPDDLLPCLRIIGTQLTPGKEAKGKRMEQIAQIIDTLAKKKLPLPTLFVGSGGNRDSEEEGKFLSQYFYHSYRRKAPTQSDELVKQWTPVVEEQEESSDYISFFKRNLPEKVLPVVEKNLRMLDCHLVKAFDESYNTKTALSDHHAVVTLFSWVRAAQASAG